MAGLLPSSYWDKPTSTPAAPSTPPDPSILMAPTSTLSPAAPATPDATVTPQPAAPTTPVAAALDEFGNPDNQSALPSSSTDSSIPVEPKQYQPGLLGYSLPNALGFGLPDPATFQAMNAEQKTLAYANGATNATKKLLGGLVSSVPQGIGGILATGIEGAEAMYQGAKQSIQQGKLISPQAAFNAAQPAQFGGKSNAHVSVPLGPFGSAPSWFKTYDDAVGQGASPLAASLLTGGTAIGDATIATGITESFGNLMKPKPTSVGQPVTDIQPIKQAIVSDGGKVKFSQIDPNTPNEYYNASPAVAKQYGGNPGNIKIKLSPVGDGTMEASIVRLTSDTSIKSKIFGKEAAPSDFNGMSETKLFSQKVPLSSQAQTDLGTSAMEVPKPPSSIVPLTPEESAARGVPVPPEETPPPIGRDAVNQIAIPKKVLPGTENLPITADQMSTLDEISKVNGLGDNVKIGITHALTGKTALGDLTNAEFVKVATQLGSLNKAEMYSPTLGMNNIAADWLQRRDSYFNSIQERTGIPTGDMYIRMENAQRAAKIATETNSAAVHDLYGKYWNDPQAGDLVNAYKGGNKAAITDNASLSPEEKADLVKIADASTALQAKMAVQYNLPEANFLENYSSHIQDRGGSVTQYSKPDEFPTGSNFFAKQKRTGSLTPLLTDDRAIMGIYNHAGAKATFMPDALKFAKSVYDSADPQYQPAIKAYADAMAGNAGVAERTLNNVAGQINQKLGWNLPPDAARKFVQLGMDTSYSMTMGVNPSTYLRQVLSNPTYVYAENGAVGLGDAMMSYFKDPAAATAEVQARGFRVRTADPYGTALADDSTFGKIGTQYRNLTAATLAPMNVVDTFGRYLMMKSSDLKFNTAIDLYNSGKLNWAQTENALGFDGLSTVDQNEIRQQLVAGNRQAAMDHLARVSIDDTQGTYRPNTLGRVNDGALGKPLSQFSTYAQNYVNMVSKWVKYGQWDKVVRLIGTQATMYNTMLHQFGLDYSGSVGANPALPNPSPTVSMAANTWQLALALKNNSQTDINTNAGTIVQTLKSVGYPGVEPNRIAQFISIYNKGPNAQGLYQVQSGSGKENYGETFSDLLFGTLFGFPVADKANATNVANDEYNAGVNWTNTQQSILQKIGQGDTAGAESLMKSSGVTISGTQLQSYLSEQNIPLTLRLLKQLPKALQPEFAKQVQATLQPSQ